MIELSLNDVRLSEEPLGIYISLGKVLFKELIQMANPGLEDQGLAKLYTKNWGFEPVTLGRTLVLFPFASYRTLVLFL